jgi:hypothetical protein
MSYSTKKYTINLLINEVSSLSSNAFTSVNTLASALSPRAGRNSAKLFVLKGYLGRQGGLARLLSGADGRAALGRTPRGRLLNVLRARKRQS